MFCCKLQYFTVYLTSKALFVQVRWFLLPGKKEKKEDEKKEVEWVGAISRQTPWIGKKKKLGAQHFRISGAVAHMTSLGETSFIYELKMSLSLLLQ